MNNTVGPIFNEKVAEKWSLWNLWTVHGCTVHCSQVKSQKFQLEKKKKKDETRFASRHGCKCSTQTGTKQFFFFGYLFCFVNNYREKLRSNNRDCAIFSIMDENLLPMS